MSRIRLYEVAKQFGLDEHSTVALLHRLGFTDVRHRLSAVDPSAVELVRAHLRGEPEQREKRRKKAPSSRRDQSRTRGVDSREPASQTGAISTAASVRAGGALAREAAPSAPVVAEDMTSFAAAIRRFGALLTARPTETLQTKAQAWPPDLLAPDDHTIDVFGTPDDPAILVRQPIADATRADRLPNSLVRGDLGRLASAAARLAETGADFARNAQRVVVVYKPEVARQLARGGLQEVRSHAIRGANRAIARGPNGRFAGNGNLVREVNPAAVAGALWQVAAIVTAQQFLASIEAKLSRIADDVAELRAYVEGRDFAKLVVAVTRLQMHGTQLHDAHLRSKDRDEIRAEARSAEREAHELSEHGINLLPSSTERVRQLPTKEFGGPSEIAKDTKRALREAHGRAAAVVLAARARIMAAVILFRCDASVDVVRPLVDQVHRDLGRLETAVGAFQRMFKKHVDMIEGMFFETSADQEHRDRLHRKAKECWDPLLVEVQALRDLARRVDASLDSSQSEPFVVEVELDATGEPVSAYRLLPAR